MNKFLLLALMLLLGVLAFALGLFSKDSSTALSQYVPDSVGEMFSKTNKLQPDDALNAPQKNNGDTAIAALVVPDSVHASVQQEASVKQLEENNLNMLKSTVTSTDTLIKIPEALIVEIQNELSPEPSPAALERIKTIVKNVESENLALKEQLIVLNEKSKESDAVLDKLEKQYKDQLNTQKVVPNERDDLLKELETQIQNLNH